MKGQPCIAVFTCNPTSMSGLRVFGRRFELEFWRGDECLFDYIGGAAKLLPAEMSERRVYAAAAQFIT